MPKKSKTVNMEDEIQVALQRNKGYSELFIAVARGNYCGLRAMIHSGKDLNSPQSTSGETIIYAVIISNNVQMVTKLIRAGADPNIEPGKLTTPLGYAISFGYLDMVEVLVENGANIHQTYDPGNQRRGTALHDSATLGLMEICKFLIERGVDVNAGGEDGITALHLAVAAGKTQVVELLIAKGADISATCTFFKETTQLEFGSNITPIFLATFSALLDIIPILVKAGADLSVKTSANYTILHLAVQLKSFQLVSLLLNAGAGVCVNVQFAGYTPLFYAVISNLLSIVEVLLKVEGIEVNVKSERGGTPLSVAVVEGHLEMVKLLVANSAAINDIVLSGITILQAALTQKHDSIAEYLIKCGADINALNTNNETLLHIAGIYGNSLEIVKMIIAKGGNVNAKTSNGNTPLDFAVTHGRHELVKFLLDAGADVNSVDKSNWISLHHAVQPLVVDKVGASLEIAKTLVSKGGNVNAKTSTDRTPLDLAAARGYFEIVKFLVEAGADLNSVDEDDWTSLHYAAASGNVPTVLYLAAKLPKIDAVSHSLTTPLQCAICSGHHDVVASLLKSGANINAQDDRKCAALHIAVENEQQEIIELLLKHNVLLNLTDKEGCTPLFLAVLNNYEKLVTQLLHAGANVNVPNKFGILPIHLAADAENVSVVEALLAKGAYYDIKAEVKNFSGTPLEFAQKVDNAKIIILLEIIRKLFSAVRKNKTAKIILCIEAGAIVNARKASGRTALHFSVSNGNRNAVEALLVGGADITLATNKGLLPIHIAVENGYSEITEILLTCARNLSFLKFKSVVNAKAGGDMPLHTAVKNNNSYIVKLLLMNGGIYNAKNKHGKTPLELMTKDTEIESLLNSVEKLFAAVKKEDGLEEVLQILEKDSSALNAREVVNGRTPLHWSILSGHTNIANALLSKGADHCLVTNEGETPLHVAALKGNVEIVKALINHAKRGDTEKVNKFINVATVGGTTALHVASNLDVVTCLLQAGITYNICNYEGKTALELVKNDVVKRLLEFVHQKFEDVRNGVSTVMDSLKGLEREEFKAVMNARNAQGQSLVQVALANSHIGIAKELLKILK